MYGVSCILCWQSVAGARTAQTQCTRTQSHIAPSCRVTALRSPLAQFSTALVPQNTFPREETTFQMFYYLASSWTHDGREKRAVSAVNNKCVD